MDFKRLNPLLLTLFIILLNETPLTDAKPFEMSSNQSLDNIFPPIVYLIMIILTAPIAILFFYSLFDLIKKINFIHQYYVDKSNLKNEICKVETLDKNKECEILS